MLRLPIPLDQPIGLVYAVNILVGIRVRRRLSIRFDLRNRLSRSRAHPKHSHPGFHERLPLTLHFPFANNYLRHCRRHYRSIPVPYRSCVRATGCGSDDRKCRIRSARIQSERRVTCTHRRRRERLQRKTRCRNHWNERRRRIIPRPSKIRTPAAHHRGLSQSHACHQQYCHHHQNLTHTWPPTNFLAPPEYSRTPSTMNFYFAAKALSSADFGPTCLSHTAEVTRHFLCKTLHPGFTRYFVFAS